MTENKTIITVEAVIYASMEKVWEFWIKPEHIIKWAFASDDWEVPNAENNVRVGGKFKIVMAAKDKSTSFDFAGAYTSIKNHELIEYDIDDGRHVKVEFTELSDGVRITESFEGEKINSEEIQRSGWQAILDNFKKYAETQSWIKKLKQEGFTEVRVCPIPPNRNLPKHTHDEHTVHIILNGELVITDTDGTKVFRPGDRAEFPAGTTHKARGATDNGTMIIGVKTNKRPMQKIIPHLWYDKEAKEAAEFYVSVFSNSKITNVTTLHDTPSGDTDVVSFELRGEPFMAISAGPLFKFNPSISFIVNFDPSKEQGAKENIDAVWGKLSEDGKILMPIQEYPFSKRYGWVQDKYGLSWQLILTNPSGEERPEIVPSLLFVGKSLGKAEEAVHFYLSVFKESNMGTMMKYGKAQEPNKEGTVMFSDFKLLDTWFAAMDGGGEHAFKFNEAISFMVYCKDQEEIDYYWEKLSAVPESEQCGWLKDKYGVSWQIVPTAMNEMMAKGTKEQIARVTEAFLKMKKFNISKLKEAYDG